PSARRTPPAAWGAANFLHTARDRRTPARARPAPPPRTALAPVPPLARTAPRRAIAPSGPPPAPLRRPPPRAPRRTSPRALVCHRATSPSPLRPTDTRRRALPDLRAARSRSSATGWTRCAAATRRESGDRRHAPPACAGRFAPPAGL